MALLALADSLPMQLGNEKISAQQMDNADPLVPVPSVQDRLLSEIADAIEENFQAMTPDDIQRVLVSLSEDVRIAPPLAYQGPILAPQACLLDALRCSEVFGTQPKPCLIATQRCESSARVVLLGSTRH
jgi:hypothetical protein